MQLNTNTKDKIPSLDMQSAIQATAILSHYAT